MCGWVAESRAAWSPLAYPWMEDRGAGRAPSPRRASLMPTMRKQPNGRWGGRVDSAPHPDGSRRQVTISEPSKDAANKAMRKVQEEQAASKTSSRCSVTLGDYALTVMASWSHDLAEKTVDRYQGIIDSFYEQFLRRVAEGRGMTIEEADAVAQGRIWTGIDAKEVGLVDELGGLERAIEIAVEMAGLDDKRYELQIIPGTEGMKFQFEVQSQSSLKKLLDAFEEDIPVARLLDRAKLIHDEKVLYLMDGVIIDN